MTARTPTYLKSVFESGDIPAGSDYSDIFDSFLPITVTGKQSLDISLEITGNFTAAEIYGDNLYAANKINAQVVSASSAIFDQVNANIVSASGGEFNVINTQSVSASSSNIKYPRSSVDSSVAATGTATAAARSITEKYSVVKSITSASQNSLIIGRFRQGFEQIIINDVSASAFIFPTSASKFDSLSNGAAKSIAPKSTLTITHITSAQYYTR